jgi:CheY-like chemotaxis protein
MLRSVLCVDDEPNLLQALERQLRKRFDFHTAVGPEKGLQTISEAGPFAVVVSDLRMPGMDGIQFLAHVRERRPDTIRVMLTGQADLTDAIAAVNEGQIFQFLTKPCPSEMLSRALEAALEQHRLITAERELLEQTLRGAVEVLSDLLSLVNPTAFGRASRIRRYVRHIAAKLKLTGQWEYEVAAMLSQIGCITVPQDVLDKAYAAQPLTPEERRILGDQARLGHDLLAKIPRMGDVAKIVAQQYGSRSGTAGESDRVGIGVQLLKTALDFDEKATSGDPVSVLEEMLLSGAYNPAFLGALAEVQMREGRNPVRVLKVSQLRTGMIANSDIRTKNHLLLLAKGQEIKASALARLQGFAATVGIIEPVSVVIAAPSDTAVSSTS